MTVLLDLKYNPVGGPSEPVWYWVSLDIHSLALGFLPVKIVSGDPDPQHVSTIFVERQNLTTQMQMQRFTRLTIGHSKKVDNHRHMVALHYMHYNFCRAHQTLRCTPAMEAGLTHHVWTIGELCALLPKSVVKASQIEALVVQKALG
jgi:hypothetical protein